MSLNLLVAVLGIGALGFLLWQIRTIPAVVGGLFNPEPDNIRDDGELTTNPVDVSGSGHGVINVAWANKLKRFITSKAWPHTMDDINNVKGVPAFGTVDWEGCGHIEWRDHEKIERRATWRGGRKVTLSSPIVGHPTAVAWLVWLCNELIETKGLPRLDLKHAGMQVYTKMGKGGHTAGIAVDLPWDIGDSFVYLLKVRGLMFGYCDRGSRFQRVMDGRTEHHGSCDGSHADHIHLELPLDHRATAAVVWRKIG